MQVALGVGQELRNAVLRIGQELEPHVGAAILRNRIVHKVQLRQQVLLEPVGSIGSSVADRLSLLYEGLVGTQSPQLGHQTEVVEDQLEAVSVQNPGFAVLQ